MLDLALLQRPAERLTEVIVLLLHAVQPCLLVPTAALGLSPVGECQEERDMPAPGLVGFSVRREPVGRVLPNRFQEDVACITIRLG